MKLAFTKKKKKGSAASLFVQPKSFHWRFLVKKQEDEISFTTTATLIAHECMHVQGCAGKLCNSVSKKKEAPLTTFSWIWQLDTEILMEISSVHEAQT